MCVHVYNEGSEEEITHIISDILQWIDKLSDHGPQKDNNHHRRIHKLPNDSPECHHTRADLPGGYILKETTQKSRDTCESKN